jgi:hypothetical protein
MIVGDRDALINVIGTILAKTTVSGVSSASARRQPEKNAY